MAHKKGRGRAATAATPTGNGVVSKRFGGQRVRAGSVLVRQLGTKFHAERTLGRARITLLRSRMAW